MKHSLQNIDRQLRECKNIQSQIDSAKSKCDQYANKDPTKTWEKDIKDCEQIVKNNNKQMRLLSEERKSLQTQSEQTAKLKFKKEQYNKTNSEYNKTMSSIKTQIVTVLNDMPPMDKLQNDFNEKTRSYKRHYDKVLQKYNELQTAHSVSESKLKVTYFI